MGRYSKRSISPVLFASRRVILPLAVLFAFGEWYLLRKLSGRIEYHCEAKPNNITTRRSRIISLRRSRNITHIAKRESFAKYLFALLSLFSLIHQPHTAAFYVIPVRRRLRSPRRALPSVHRYRPCRSCPSGTGSKGRARYRRAAPARPRYSDRNRYLPGAPTC